MKISERLFIDMYAVSNKVEGEEFESEVKPKTEVVLAAILAKNSKNGQKWDFGSPYLKNSTRYDIDMSVVFDKVDDV